MCRTPPLMLLGSARLAGRHGGVDAAARPDASDFSVLDEAGRET